MNSLVRYVVMVKINSVLIATMIAFMIVCNSVVSIMNWLIKTLGIELISTIPTYSNCFDINLEYPCLNIFLYNKYG